MLIITASGQRIGRQIQWDFRMYGLDRGETT
ncbi:hypothetical protein [Escherichia phage Ecp_YSF]|nr:hypothetical protein [Escherichia phage Ecp_YSF]